MKYNLNKFVNVTSKKTGRAILSVSQDEFEKSVKFDAVNEEAFPVYVYEQNGRPVAWYDEEFEAGYVV